MKRKEDERWMCPRRNMSLGMQCMHDACLDRLHQSTPLLESL